MPINSITVDVSQPTSKEEASFLAGYKSHILHKAGLKELDAGRCVTLTWTAKLKNFVMGNNAQARYRRADFESRQLNSCAVWAARHRAAQAGQPLDLHHDKSLQLRLNREDFRRFNRPLLVDPQNNTSARNKMATRFSRFAKWCNGISELGAAPTGMMLQIMKDLTMPNRHDSTMGAQARALCTLVAPVFPAVAYVGVCLSNAAAGISTALAGQMGKSVAGAVGSFNAVTAVSALFSLGASATAGVAAKRQTLSDQTVDWVTQEQTKHTRRLVTLIQDMRKQPGARLAVCRALRGKIPSERCLPGDDGKTREPILIDALIQAVKSATNGDEACNAVDHTLGRYLNVKRFDLPDDAPGNLIRDDVHSKHRIAREKDVLALTNLIQHARFDAIDPDRHNDIRTDIQDAVKRARAGTVKSFADAADHANHSTVARALRHGQEGLEPTLRDKQKNNPQHGLKWIGSNDQMLANHHQYGPCTLFFARCAEGMRVFSHGVLLSTNYQLTRPFAWAFGRLTELLPNVTVPGRDSPIQLRGHQSRAVSFSVGRFFSSAIWAVAESFLILPLAAGGGVAYTGQGPISGVEFPLKPIGGKWMFGFSVVSTALQMIMVAGLTLPMVALAKGAFVLEGWQGNIRRSDPGLKKRDRLTWE
ncbi:MAG TPA: hypothetical protein VGE55_10220 [Limnobacter sp.]|uniref:hypothetical protein n=1 Tax=Limnobacter sp. TaxID=2003368 RepID=UPI002ED9DD6B